MSTENSGKNSGNVENLVPHQFRPGQSGNPGGRPKRLPITDYLRVQLDKPVPASMKAQLPPVFREVYGDNPTFGEMLAFRLIADAARGNMQAISTVLDRSEGKVPPQTPLPGENPEPITFRVIRVEA